MCDVILCILKVERGHKSTSVIRDFCDGKCFASHPVYSADASALQIFFYFDELEVCNPLGSKTKVHKLGMNSSISVHGYIYN